MQKIEKTLDVRQIAYAYYSIISIVNEIKIGKKEINLLSSMAVEGVSFDRNKWIQEYDSTKASYYNMRGRLTKRRFLIEGKVNPVLLPDFNKIDLQIVLWKNNTVET